MFTIGLTGNIGTGKTTVANCFAKLGIPIIDTDQLAREVVLPGTVALEKIVAHFSKNILLKDGQLDRKSLRERIFQHPEDRVWLENLLHPIIQKKAIQTLTTLNAPYALYVIPLLIGRKNKNTFIDRILLVDAPLELQQSRARARDQMDLPTFKAILSTQASREALLRAADDVIINDASFEDLNQQVLTLHQKYLDLR